MHRQICFKMPPLVLDLAALEYSFSANLVLSSEKTGISASLDVPSLDEAKKETKIRDEITEKPTKKQNEVKPLKPLQVPPYGVNKMANIDVDHDKQKQELPLQPAQNDAVESSVHKEQQKQQAHDLEPTQKTKERVTQMKMPEEFDQQQLPNQSEVKAVAQTLRSAMKSNSTELVKPAEPLKRFMFSALKYRSWPTTKNIKVGMHDWMEPNQINVFEDDENVRAWQEHVQKKVNDYCKDEMLSKYKPM